MFLGQIFYVKGVDKICILSILKMLLQSLEIFFSSFISTKSVNKFMESANCHLLCKVLGISKWMRTHLCPVEAHSFRGKIGS